MQYIYRTFYVIIIILLLTSCESNNAYLRVQEDVDFNLTNVQIL